MAWCVVFTVYMSFIIVSYFIVNKVSDMRRIDHGHDHDWNLCGISPMEDKPFAFYPDLASDFAKEGSLKHRYGVCVEQCPPQGDVVWDYGDKPRRASWLAALPSFPVFGRCVPYEPAAATASTMMCAFPGCIDNSTGFPDSPREVCGITRDGSDRYWLLSEPDAGLIDGWRSEGASEELVERRIAIASSASLTDDAKDCAQPLERTTKTSIGPKDQAIQYEMIIALTAPLYKWAVAIWDNLHLVLGLGLGGSLALSTVLILLFPCCAHVVIILLVGLLFVALVISDYILFVQAGIATGRTGHRVASYVENSLNVTAPEAFDDILRQSSDDQTLQQVYTWSAYTLAVVIAILFCLLFVLRQNFRLLIALLNQATKAIRRLPGLLGIPFALLFTLVLATVFLLRLGVGVATINPEAFEHSDIIDTFHLDDEETRRKFKKGGMWTLVFTLVWVYFFHVGLFVTIVAHSVTTWYFRKHGEVLDAARHVLGFSIIASTSQICRYHLGSVAKGSFLMAVCTMPRIIFEYFQAQAEGVAQANALVRAIVCATRCFLWCLQTCLQFMTEYAYVYVSVTGAPFCNSARQSFVLCAKYFEQVALDKLMSTALGWITTITVPATLGVIAFAFLGQDLEVYQACTLVILVIAYVTCRMVVGVYDIVLTTLFICVMRDEELCGGEHMDADLRKAVGLPPKAEETELS